MNLKIQLVNTNKEYQEILNIRKLVFVEEQNVPIDIEIEYEDESHHIICYHDDLPVATGRWRETSFGIKLERFAVLHEFRGMGIGKQIVNLFRKLFDASKDNFALKVKSFLNAKY